METDSLSQRDPWELPPCFLLRNNRSRKNENHLRTYSGCWKEKQDEFIAIRSGDGSSSSSGSPSYIGVRKTLEFYLEDGTRGGEGTKTDWRIHEYHHLRREDDEAALFLEEDLVLRKVFKKGEADQASSLCAQVESSVKAYNKAWSLYPSLRREFIIIPDYVGVKNITRSRENVKMSRRWQAIIDEYLDEYRERLNGGVGAHCPPDGKSDDVWQHFTKIDTEDPDVVYAACHHCDRILEAHPNKHGIETQLRKHRNSDKCRSSCSYPSTDEDREMLHRLRTELDLYRQPNMDGNVACQEAVNANLTQLNPWVLGPNNHCYVTTSLNRQTNEGCWEEVKEEFTAVRMEQLQMQGCWTEDIAANGNDQMQMQVPQYIGLRRTLVFYYNLNGNKLKTGWIMLEYQQVDDIKSPALHLQADMIIRKVFFHDKDAVTSAFSDLDNWLNGDNDSKEYYNGEGVKADTPPMSSDYMDGGRGDRKRKRTAASKRTSEVWMYFTEIRTTDRDVVYAVCHYCDRGYGSGRSTNGTTHLWRHKKMCSSKHHPAGTGSVSDANAAWEAAIRPFFLLFKNCGGSDLC